jgi:hypothetical protein
VIGFTDMQVPFAVVAFLAFPLSALMSFSAQQWNTSIPFRILTQIQNHFFFVRFEVFTAVTMKNGVFCDVRPRGTYKNRFLGGTSVFTRATPRNIQKTPFLIVTAVKTSNFT